MYQLLAFGLIVLTIMVAVLIIQVPVFIARARGIYGSDLTTITILSWLGILLGITWIIALILSLVWGPVETAAAATPGADSDIDKLEQLHRLKKAGAITQKEFDAEKKKILK